MGNILQFVLPTWSLTPRMSCTISSTKPGATPTTGIQWLYFMAVSNGYFMGRLCEDYVYTYIYYIIIYIYIYNTNMSSFMDCVWNYGMPSNSNSNAKMINQRSPPRPPAESLPVNKDVEATAQFDDFCENGDLQWSSTSMLVYPRIPSGYVKIAIENGHRNSGFSH